MQSGGMRTSDDRRRTALLAILVIVVALLAFGGGFVLGNGREDAASPSPTPSPATSPTPSDSPSPEAPPSPSEEPGGTLADGRHFVYVKDATDSSLTFDLAYFLTGEKANAAAAEHGDEVPVPNDVYIVNDNALLRIVTVSPGVIVRYIPASAPDQTVLQPGNFPAFVGEVTHTLQTDYPDMTVTPWWITITGGQIVRVEQQFLP
jgi:hypothetical protein